MTTTIHIGPPGTGKTTTLTRLVCEDLERGGNPMICSMTRTAKAEVAARKIPIEDKMIGTIHAHAFRACGQPKIAQKHHDDFNEQYPALSLSGGRSTDPDEPYVDRHAKTQGDRLQHRMDVLRARMVPQENWTEEVQMFARAYSHWKDECGYMDFTDMVAKAIEECPRPPHGPSSIYVDEAQDMSALELKLLKQWSRWAGDLIIVGDPYQALYVWRGAHPEMFTSEKVRPENRHVLAQSYRIPRAVHAAAMSWVRRLREFIPIEYRPRDLEGLATGLPYSYRLTGDILNLAERCLDEGKTVMICASCSHLLNSVVKEARMRGLPFANPWRTKRGDWNPLHRGSGTSMSKRILSFLRTDRKIFGESAFAFGDNWRDSTEKKARAWTYSELADWVDVIGAKGVLKVGAKTQILTQGRSDDTAGVCLAEHDIDHWFMPQVNPFVKRVFHGEESTEESVRWFANQITSKKQEVAAYPLEIFNRHGIDAIRERPRLFIGTIHSFKGAQADVVIMFPDLAPAGMQEWMSQQSDNIVRMFYVGMTRARESLYITQPASMRCAPVQDEVR